MPNRTAVIERLREMAADADALEAGEAEFDALAQAADLLEEGESRTEYRVVDRDCENPGGTWFTLDDARASLVRCGKGWPEERPHRIQKRTITESPWTDVEGEDRG